MILCKKTEKALPTLKSRGVYAIHTGIFAGELLVYIDSSKENYNFLSLPKMNNRSIPYNIFDSGLKSNIVKFAEILPGKVYKICHKQYLKNCGKA